MSDTGSDSINVTWHRSLEEYLAATGEKAQGLAWCHKRAEEMYSHRRTLIDLPVIILSGITGFCSVGSNNIFGAENAQASSIVLGCASLVVSTLNTVGAYFAWAKRAEGHRISSIQYSRLYRDIVVELNLPRSERRSPTIILKDIKDEYDRLQEISPLLPPEIITMFHKKFDSETEISKPEETNGLENIHVYPLDPSAIPTPSQITTVYAKNGSFEKLVLPTRRINTAEVSPPPVVALHSERSDVTADNSV